MVDVFTLVIRKLYDMGAFNFLFPFMLTTAIFYGLLRKSKIFSTTRETKEGKVIEVSQGVNSVVALVAGFMVWAYPVLQGVDVQTQLSAFFMQGMIVTLIFVVGLMILSMFAPPDLPKYLKERIFEKGGFGAVLVIAVAIGIVIFITSGLINMIVGPVFSGINLSNDSLLTVVVLGLLIVPLIFIFRGGEGETKTPSGETPHQEEGERRRS